MHPRRHRLPEQVLSRLAAGGGGAAAARHLVAAQHSKQRLLVLGVVRLATDRGHPHARVAERAYDTLAALEKRCPEAVRATLAYPAVGAWAGHTVQALVKGGDAGDPARLGAVAAAAALRAGAECRVTVPAPGGRITLPSLGELVLGEEAGLTDLVVHSGGEVEAQGARVRPGAVGEPFWRPLRRLEVRDGTFTPLVDDLDPFRWTAGTVVDGRLTEEELRGWQTCLDAAWDILKERHWTIAEETRAITSVLTPIRGPSRGMNSASAGDRFGTLAMSAPPDGLWLASTFAHEVQHAKLGAVLDVVRLLEPDDGRYYAPWRPDPRPLSGLLQGAYAYLGVAGFWRRQRAAGDDPRPHIEFAHWREAAAEVAGTLARSGRLTPAGERFVTGMRRTLAAWLTEPVPSAALSAARREADAHRDAWRERNGPLPEEAGRRFTG